MLTEWPRLAARSALAVFERGAYADAHPKPQEGPGKGDDIGGRVWNPKRVVSVSLADEEKEHKKKARVC